MTFDEMKVQVARREELIRAHNERKRQRAEDTTQSGFVPSKSAAESARILLPAQCQTSIVDLARPDANKAQKDIEPCLHLFTTDCFAQGYPVEAFCSNCAKKYPNAKNLVTLVSSGVETVQGIVGEDEDEAFEDELDVAVDLLSQCQEVMLALLDPVFKYNLQSSDKRIMKDLVEEIEAFLKMSEEEEEEEEKDQPRSDDNHEHPSHCPVCALPLVRDKEMALVYCKNNGEHYARPIPEPEELDFDAGMSPYTQQIVDRVLNNISMRSQR